MAREMKDSGVKWIGEIPKDWSVVQLKRHSKVVSGKEVPVELDADDSIAIPVYGSGGIFKYTDRIQYNGEVVMFGRKGTIGKPLYVNDKFWAVDTMYFLLHNKNHLSPKYNFYQLSAFNWDFYTTQTALPSIVASEVLDSKFPLPPLPEQKAIADFLDKKCAEIDGLLADLEAEVKTLAEYKKSIISEVTTQGLNQNVKKKQSGIDWVGNIPAHWQVVPFRSYVVERTEKNLGGRNKNLLALSFALGVTRYADKKYNMDRVKDDFCGYQIVHEKDLVLSPNDIIKGSIFVSEYKGCISPMYRVFSNYDPETYNLYYLSYHLRTKESGRKFFYIARGLIGEILDNGKYVTRRMSVSQQDLLKFKVLLPPIEEQNEIVRYLDEKCVFIEQAIADKQTQIETLKSYKSSLIYEYVTGKKQVI